MAKKTVGRFFVWIIMGLLFIGLMGFGATGLTGTVNRLGTAGDKPIRTQDYARALTEQIRAFEAQIGQPLSFAQAQAFGLDRAVLGQVVTARMLDNEATRMGLSAGDAAVAEQVLAQQAFRGPDGQFNRDAYRFTLERNGLTEAEFERSLREDIARSLLQAAVVAGIPEPDAYADAVVAYVGARRDITWAAIGPQDLPAPLPAPTEAALEAFYDADPAIWSLPETREITYAWLTPEMIQDAVTVDEASLEQLYQDRINEFVQPERRLVERLVFQDEAAAQAARDRVTADAASFEDLVAERGLDLADADMGDVTQDQLGAAGEAVFAAAPGEVVGPFGTSVGPALFRMNAVLAAEEITFEEARANLRDELAAARARRIITEAQNNLQDLIAGGATVEDLAQQSEMELGTIVWSEGESDGIAAYDTFRAAAAAATSGALPQVLEFENGGIFALRLDAVNPPAPQPFADVREPVAAAWRATATQDALMAEAERRAEALRSGDMGASRPAPAAQPTLDMLVNGTAPLAAEAATTVWTTDSGLTRRSFVAGTPEGFMAQVFAMDQGEIRVIPAPAIGEGPQASQPGAIVVRLDATAPPDAADPAMAAERSAVAERAAAGIAQDLFELYARSVQEATDLQIDEAAVNAVHAQFQ